MSNFYGAFLGQTCVGVGTTEEQAVKAAHTARHRKDCFLQKTPLEKLEVVELTKRLYNSYFNPEEDVCIIQNEETGVWDIDTEAKHGLLRANDCDEEPSGFGYTVKEAIANLVDVRTEQYGEPTICITTLKIKLVETHGQQK